MKMKKFVATLSLALMAGGAFAGGSGNKADEHGASWDRNQAAIDLGSKGAAQDIAACKALVRDLRNDRVYGDDVKHGEKYARFGLAVMGDIRFYDATFATDFAYYCLSDQARWQGGSLYGTRDQEFASLQRWQDWHAQWRQLKRDISFAASALNNYYANKAKGGSAPALPGYPLPTTDEQAKRLEKVMVSEATELLDSYPMMAQGWYSKLKGTDEKSQSKKQETDDFLSQVGVK